MSPMPSAGWPALKVVMALSLAIVAQALLRAVLTYSYNMVTARLTQGVEFPYLLLLISGGHCQISRQGVQVANVIHALFEAADKTRR